MKIRQRKENSAYLITISCLKVLASNFDEAYEMVMKPRSKVVRKFILEELHEITHPIGKVAKDIEFDTILYEVEDITNFETEAFYFNIKIYFALKPKRKKHDKRKSTKKNLHGASR